MARENDSLRTYPIGRILSSSLYSSHEKKSNNPVLLYSSSCADTTEKGLIRALSIFSFSI